MKTSKKSSLKKIPVSRADLLFMLGEVSDTLAIFEEQGISRPVLEEVERKLQAML